MRGSGISIVLSLVLSLLALATALDGAYLGSVAALVALTALFSIRVLAGRMELRRWRLASDHKSSVRMGPLAQARAQVREAAAGNEYFRSQVADALLRASAIRGGASLRPSRSELSEAQVAILSSSREKGPGEVLDPSSASTLRGRSYLSALNRAMDLIENG